MNLQENNLEEFAMHLSPEGDDPKTETGTDGSGNSGGADDPGKE